MLKMQKTKALFLLFLFAFIAHSSEDSKVVPRLKYNLPSIEELNYWYEEQSAKLNFVKMIDYPEFDGYELHPQGMIKIGEEFILSAVDVRGKKKQNKKLEVGFLQKFIVNDNGEIEMLKNQQVNGLQLNYEGQAMSDHHPGGMDIDLATGELIIPVAQYNPNTTTTFLIVNPDDLNSYQVSVRANDHIGAVVCGVQDGKACRVLFNWDSKDAYKVDAIELKQSGMFRITDSKRLSGNKWAFQDCKYIGNDVDDAIYALCTATKPSYSIVMIKITKEGKVITTQNMTAPKFGSYKIALIDSLMGVKSMAQNPMTFEKVVTEQGYKIRFYFLPHNHTEAKLFIYESDEVVVDISHN